MAKCCWGASSPHRRRSATVTRWRSWGHKHMRDTSTHRTTGRRTLTLQAVFTRPRTQRMPVSTGRARAARQVRWASGARPGHQLSSAAGRAAWVTLAVRTPRARGCFCGNQLHAPRPPHPAADSEVLGTHAFPFTLGRGPWAPCPGQCPGRQGGPASSRLRCPGPGRRPLPAGGFPAPTDLMCPPKMPVMGVWTKSAWRVTDVLLRGPTCSHSSSLPSLPASCSSPSAEGLRGPLDTRSSARTGPLRGCRGAAEATSCAEGQQETAQPRGAERWPAGLPGKKACATCPSRGEGRPPLGPRSHTDARRLLFLPSAAVIASG